LVLVGNQGNVVGPSLLAVWIEEAASVLSTASCSGASDAWTRPHSWKAAIGRNLGRFTALLPPGGGARVIWAEESLENWTSELRFSFSKDAQQEWTASARLVVDSPGYDPANPVATVAEDRLFLQISEDRMASKPLIVTTSQDGGSSFKLTGRMVYPYCKSPRTVICAYSRRLWSVFYSVTKLSLMLSKSIDGGETWSACKAIDDRGSSLTQPALVAGRDGAAWLLFTNSEGRVKLARLP
jgi:hypothetical protein